MAYLTGNTFAALFLLFCGILGAGLFAQAWWGSSILLRPFGYWGAVLGVMLGVFLVNAWIQIPLSTIAIAGVLCAPYVQAIGRFRCLSQGCCHGVVTEAQHGIRVWQAQSRVCALSGLQGQWIQITQLYSISFNLILGFVLWAMWYHAMPSALIVAAYLVLTGVERFAEDAYRGEKQTKTIRGLKEPQWIALISILAGFMISFLPLGFANPALGQVDIPFVLVVLVAGFVTAFAMGMDFPKSTWRFSRLSG